MFYVALDNKNKPLFYAELAFLPKIHQVITALNENDDDIFFHIESCEEKKYKSQVKDIQEALDIIENAYIFA